MICARQAAIPTTTSSEVNPHPLPWLIGCVVPKSHVDTPDRFIAEQPISVLCKDLSESVINATTLSTAAYPTLRDCFSCGRACKRSILDLRKASHREPKPNPRFAPHVIKTRSRDVVPGKSYRCDSFSSAHVHSLKLRSLGV